MHAKKTAAPRHRKRFVDAYQRDQESATPALFAHFASNGKWHIAPHLALLSRYMVDLCVAGPTDIRAMLCMMPPRHGKSTLINKYFPTWYLGHYPDNQIGIITYGGEFSAEWGGKAREVCERAGPYYFGIQPNYRRKADHDWNIIDTVRGELREGRCRSIGVGGPITGKGFHCLILDDLIKNKEEADSPLMREKIYLWLTQVAFTRLEPGCIIIGVGTRWHEDDWQGRLIEDANRGGLKFHLLNLPAIADQHEPEFPFSVGREPGQALWPQRYPINAHLAPPEWKGGLTLEDQERIQGPYGWSALYQQRPTPQEGGLFKKHWFKFWKDRLPPMDKMVRYWDFASSESLLTRDPDYTCGVLMGKKGDNYFVIDVVRFQGEPARVERIVKQTAYRDGVSVPIHIEREPGSAGAHLIYHFATKVLPGFAVREGQARTTKTIRADPFSATAAQGVVYLVQAEWNAAWLAEIGVFPNGAHDDQVDASAGAFNLIAPARITTYGQAGERENFSTYQPR